MMLNAYFVDAGEAEYDPLDGEVYDCAVVRATGRGQAQYIFWLKHLVGEGGLTEFRYRVRLIKKDVTGSVGSVENLDPLWQLTCPLHWGETCLCAHVEVEVLAPCQHQSGWIARYVVDDEDAVRISHIADLGWRELLTVIGSSLVANAEAD